MSQNTYYSLIVRLIFDVVIMTSSSGLQSSNFSEGYVSMLSLIPPNFIENNKVNSKDLPVFMVGTGPEIRQTVEQKVI